MTDLVQSAELIGANVFVFELLKVSERLVYRGEQREVKGGQDRQFMGHQFLVTHMKGVSNFLRKETSYSYQQVERGDIKAMM